MLVHNAFWGSLMAGGVAVAVNTRSSQPEVEFVLQDAGVTVDPAAAGPLPDGDPLVIDGLGRSDVAAFFCTSGTTGNPKGVPTTHEAFLANAGNVLTCLGLPADIGAGLRTLIPVPLFHVTGCNSQLLVAARGHRRSGTAAAGWWPRRTAGPARPGRPGNDPVRCRRAGRMRPPERRAAGQATGPGDPASTRTAAAAPRTAAPSPTRHPQREPPESLAPSRPHSPAARSYRPRTQYTPQIGPHAGCRLGISQTRTRSSQAEGSGMGNPPAPGHRDRGDHQ